MNSLRRYAYLEPVAVLCVFLVGLGLRLYRLPEFPPGLTFDEAANGLDALDVLGGARSIFFLRHDGREPLFIYLQAASIAMLGATPFALRLTSALVGAATVPALYWMVREAFWGTAPRPRWLAFWSALFLATSYWHLNFSRIGYRAIMVPLLACLVFALFWRAWRGLSRTEGMPWAGLLGCGALVGASLYTYLAARFLPVLVAIEVGSDLVSHRHVPAEFRKRLLGLTVITVTALVVFSPLAAYFISHPGSFVARATDVSIYSSDLSVGDTARDLWQSATGTAGMFTVSGDVNVRHNPAQRSILDPVTGIAFVAGLAVCLRRWRSLPHLFLLFWMVVFALPPILAATEIPHFLRSLAMAPAVCVVPVVALLAVGEVGGERWRRIARWLPLPVLLLSSAVGMGGYFAAMEAGPAPRMAFQENFATLATYMSGHDSDDGAWVLPIVSPYAWTRPSTDNFTVQFLYRGRAPWGVVSADPNSAPARLAELTKSRERAYLVHHWGTEAPPESPYLYADPKGLLPFLLAKHGRYAGETDAGAFTYRTYDLPIASDYRVATAYLPADASFGGKVRLSGYAYGRTATSRDDVSESLDERRVASGQSAWVTLRWQAQTPITLDLKTTLFLTDAGGHLAGQVDDLLVSDAYPFSRIWETGQTAYSYHILPTLPAVAPGDYGLYLGVYEATTQQRWGAVSGGSVVSSTVLLGSLAVTPAITLAEVAPGHRLSAETVVAPGLRLVGYDLDGEAFGPGDRIPLTLYWQGRSAPLADYRVSLLLQEADGRGVVEQALRPVGGQYATSHWREGEMVRDWQDLTVPVTLPAGDYWLALRVVGTDGSVGTATLGRVAVRGRPRVFAAPAVQHPADRKLGDGMRLIGYDLEESLLRPGGAVRLTLHWRAEGEMNRSYTVFVHLLDATGRVRAQQDSVPGAGALLTTGWAPGEYLDDHYQIPLSADTPAGEYMLEVGAYDAATGLRLAVTGAVGEAMGDHVILPQPIRVVAP